MDDTISRRAAIDAIKEDKIDLTNPNVVAVFKATGDFEKVETQVMTCDRHIEILKDLPSTQPKQPEQRWIPCSERLPEPDERVLVYTTANEYHVWDAMPHRGEGYEWEDEEGLYHSLYEVEMWLPLPEPYAERRQND